MKFKIVCSAVLLDDRDRRSVYVSDGLAHGFLVLQDNSTVMYLCSTEYNPQREHAICATDPALAIDWPVVDGIALRMSERDADAPSLEQVRAAGLLPSCNETRTFVDRLRRDPRCLGGFGVDGWWIGGFGVGVGACFALSVNRFGWVPDNSNRLVTEIVVTNYEV